MVRDTNPAATEAAGIENEEISAEILAAIAAAVTVFLGKNSRLLSVSHSAQQSRWMRQGRTFIQASHNVRKKR